MKHRKQINNDSSSPCGFMDHGWWLKNMFLSPPAAPKRSFFFDSTIKSINGAIDFVREGKEDGMLYRFNCCTIVIYENVYFLSGKLLFNNNRPWITRRLLRIILFVTTGQPTHSLRGCRVNPHYSFFFLSGTKGEKDRDGWGDGIRMKVLFIGDIYRHDRLHLPLQWAISN